MPQLPFTNVCRACSDIWALLGGFTQSLGLNPLCLSVSLQSSPHLVQVRERIRINGQPISKELFSKYFWQVYNRLEESKVSAAEPVRHQCCSVRGSCSLSLMVSNGLFPESPIPLPDCQVGCHSLAADHAVFVGLFWGGFKSVGGFLWYCCKPWGFPRSADPLCLVHGWWCLGYIINGMNVRNRRIDKAEWLFSISRFLPRVVILWVQSCHLCHFVYIFKIILVDLKHFSAIPLFKKSNKSIQMLAKCCYKVFLELCCIKFEWENSSHNSDVWLFLL